MIRRGARAEWRVVHVRGAALRLAVVTSTRSHDRAPFVIMFSPRSRLLNQFSRRYSDGDAENAAAAVEPPQNAVLTGASIQAAAQRYLDVEKYVR